MVFTNQNKATAILSIQGRIERRCLFLVTLLPLKFGMELHLKSTGRLPNE